MTEEEIIQSAEYLRGDPVDARVKVVETSLVPRPASSATCFSRSRRRSTELINGRIIEVPEDEERSETVRDPRAGFIAYVPEGSLAKGKRLVTLGGATIVNGEIVQGKTTPCTACHAPTVGSGQRAANRRAIPSYIRGNSSTSSRALDKGRAPS